MYKNKRWFSTMERGMSILSSNEAGRVEHVTIVKVISWKLTNDSAFKCVVNAFDLRAELLSGWELLCLVRKQGEDGYGYLVCLHEDNWAAQWLVELDLERWWTAARPDAVKYEEKEAENVNPKINIQERFELEVMWTVVWENALFWGNWRMSVSVP